MRKGFLAVAVLASAVLFACPKPKPAPEPAPEPAVEPAVEPASKSTDAGAPDAGCPNGTCPDGGTGCLDVELEPAPDGGKKFDPPPAGAWSMCPGQSFVLESETDKDACVDLRTADGQPVTQGALPGGGVWSSGPLPGNMYCVSVCWDKDKKGKDCSAGCKNTDCKQGPDTIRGNLDVIVKDPDPLQGPRDAGTP